MTELKLSPKYNASEFNIIFVVIVVSKSCIYNNMTAAQEGLKHKWFYTMFSKDWENSLLLTLLNYAKGLCGDQNIHGFVSGGNQT